MPTLAAALREAYDKPAERLARGARGLEWVTTARTWERACVAVEGVVKDVLEKRSADLKRKYAVPITPIPQAVPSIPAGVPMPQIIIQGPVHVHGNNPQEIAQALVDTQSQPVMLVESKDGQ